MSGRPLLFSPLIIALGMMIAAAPPVRAQTSRAIPAETLRIDDQPGYVPTPQEEQLPAVYRPQLVFFRTTEPAGTVVVHTSERFLYVVQENNRAIRYGIGVGREGFQWQGLVKITRKAEWPDWTPPSEMIARQPYLPRLWQGGRAIRWARGRSISVPPCTVSTAPTSRRRSVTRYRRAASDSLTAT